MIETAYSAWRADVLPIELPPHAGVVLPYNHQGGLPFYIRLPPDKPKTGLRFRIGALPPGFLCPGLPPLERTLVTTTA